MDADVLARCPSCGGDTPAKAGDSRVPCRYCGALIRIGMTEVRVEGHSAEDVAAVTRATLAEHGEAEAARTRLRSPWISGSFYLTAFVAILAVLLVAGAVLPWWVLPIVAIGGLLGVAVVGALQLRQDEQLSEKNFIALMGMTLARLPLILRAPKPE